MLGRPASLPDIEEIKKAYLRHGVLELRDMGNRFNAGFLARKILCGDIAVKSCGHALFRKGTYGSFLGTRLCSKAGLSLVQILAAACMDAGEVEKGNYLLVREDFIETGKIEGVYKDEILCQEA